MTTATKIEWHPIIGGGWYADHNGRHYEVVRREPPARFVGLSWGLWIDDVLIVSAESAKEGKRLGQDHAESWAEAGRQSW